MDGGLALLRSPSKALQDTVKLLSSWADQDPTNRPSPLPVLDFVTRRHDLVLLRSSMELALRKAACRVFAMEVDLRVTVFFFDALKLNFAILLESILATTTCYSARVSTRSVVVVGVIVGSLHFYSRMGPNQGTVGIRSWYG